MEENSIDKNAQLFFGLVTSLSTQAWIQLGKLKNPISDKIERDLQGASMSIDMLDMLKAKMSGNLSNDEENLLTTSVRDLKMNYVEELNKPQENQEEKESEEKTDEQSKEPESNSV